MQFAKLFEGIKQVDIIFLSIFFGLLALFIVFFIFKKITDKKSEKALHAEIERVKNTANLEKEEVVAPETEEAQEEVVALEVKEVQEEVVAPEVKEVQEEVVALEAKEAQEEVVVTEAKEVQEEVVAPEVKEVQEEVVVTEVEEVQEETKTRTYEGKYEIYQEGDNYRFRLKASNGEILIQSEILPNHDAALRSIATIKRNIEKGKILVFSDKRKNYKFKLVSGNHRILVISANYSSEARAQSASESFKRFALTNIINDVELPAEELDNTMYEVHKQKTEDIKGGKFIYRKDENGEFTWELKANNKEVLCRGTGYISKSSLDNAVLSFKTSVKNGKFYGTVDKNDLHQLKLYSATGRLALVGESYPSRQALESAVTSILNFLDLAVVTDRTELKTRKTTTTKTVTKTVVTSSK